MSCAVRTHMILDVAEEGQRGELMSCPCVKTSIALYCVPSCPDLMVGRTDEEAASLVRRVLQHFGRSDERITSFERI